MDKLIMFILLELFTIRYHRDYCLSTIKNVRAFIFNHIKKYDDLLHFKLNIHSDAILLSKDEYSCVRDFVVYLNSIDNIVKM